MLTVYTENPKGLLKAIYDDIDNNKVRTWAYDKDGNFTHDNTQWEGRAWLHPQIKTGILELGIIGTKSGLTIQVYAMYHGRFIEMLLAHYDTRISKITSSSLAICPPDVLKGT